MWPEDAEFRIFAMGKINFFGLELSGSHFRESSGQVDRCILAMRGESMAKVTGLGGVFLRARDPKALYSWYEKHLGLVLHPGGFLTLAEAQKEPPMLSLFKQESEYFPKSQSAMLNFQVDALDPLLDALIAAGIDVDPKRDRSEYGNFGWFTDPEGNRVELWEPKE